MLISPAPPLKEAVCAHLRAKGWKITDLMFHRVGLRVGAEISEGNFERALLFCGTGMGIHIAASKCPRVHAGVVESVPAALRAITGNGVNVLAMDELDAFDYEEYKARGFKVDKLGDFDLKMETKPED